MCGRYSMAVPGDVVAELFELGAVPDLAPRWNIAPTQSAPIVRATDDGTRAVHLVRWGLVPSWAKDAKIGNRMINARSETAATKPSFRSAWKRRRCLVVADGYYEWQRTTEGKVPTRIQRRDGAPLAFAGLWERWTGGTRSPDAVPVDSGPLDTFTILTMDAAPAFREIHDRMPVILSPAVHGAWLDRSFADPAAVTGLLEAPPVRELEAFAVSTRVNSPRNDDPSLAEPAG